MAGVKETPRQRMIGMMYLVLTALLALNVSKEIVNAFVKLNDKLEASNSIIDHKIEETYRQFDLAMSIKNTRKAAEPWNKKAQQVKKLAEQEYAFLLDETNALLKEVEGSSTNWVEVNRKTGKKELKSLMDVEAKDEYDAATRLFVGSNPLDPIQRGKSIRKRMHQLRDELCGLVANYSLGKKNFYFDAKAVQGYDPKLKSSQQLLKKALAHVNPSDTSKIIQLFKTLSYPEKMDEYGETISWEGSMFDHSPVVAAAALFTSIRLDIKTAESIAVEELYNKIQAPVFPVNKIEPVAFAPTGYLNMGDTMPLKVMIAAYDSNNVSPIRFSSDENLADFHETKGSITIKADSPGEKKIYGQIGVKERGELVWKPWSFRYEVGAPMASIAHLDLDVLYASFDNHISANASGYSAEKLQLSATNADVVRDGKNYIVKVKPSLVGQKITLSVSAEGKKLGSMTYRVKGLPKPSTFLGDIDATESRVTKSKLLTAVNSGLRLGYDANSIVTVPCKVLSFEVEVNVGNGVSKIYASVNGKIPPQAMETLRQIRTGSTVTFRTIKGEGKMGQIRGVPISLMVI